MLVFFVEHDYEHRPEKRWPEHEHESNANRFLLCEPTPLVTRLGERETAVAGDSFVVRELPVPYSAHFDSKMETLRHKKNASTETK